MKAKILFFDDIFSDAFRETLDSHELLWDDNWVKAVETSLTEGKKTAGMDFKLVKSGEIENSLDVIEAQKPDALLLDMFWAEQAKQLHGDGSKGVEVGLGALRRIRAVHPDLPIVAYTMKPDVTLMERAYAAGATFFAEKNPMALPEVQNALVYILHYLLCRRS